MTYTAKIIKNERLDTANALFDMEVYAPDIAAAAVPGQIAHILCGSPVTLRRPLSICQTGTDGHVRFCYEARGEGTALLSEMKPGGTVNVMGPSGKGFTVDKTKRAVLVGGGIGIFPLLSLAGAYGNSTVLLGFRNAGFVCLTDDFAAAGAEVSVISDDGSTGRGGFVTELLTEHLDKRGADIVCVCGPRPMMAACARICAERGVYCEVSMEERMACGVGACLGCAVPMTAGPYKRACVDGPVFNSAEVAW